VIEKRQYVRMSTVFPVEIEFPQEPGKKSSPHLLQAFTRDVSAGGMCLELKILAHEIEKEYFIPSAQLALTINPLFAKRPIQATAKIVWFKKQEAPLPPCYLAGVVYTQIDEKERSRLIRYAKRQWWLPRLVVTAGILLVGLVAIFFIQNQRLVSENKAIIERFHENTEKAFGISSKLYQLQKREQALSRALSRSQAEVRKLNASIAVLAVEDVQQKETHQRELATSLERQRKLDEELKHIAQRKEKLEVSYQTLQKDEAPLTKTALHQMAEWIKTHRNLHTGLVASYEGDASLSDWAFTYDQSLASQVFLVFGDLKSAKEILSFYADRAEKSEGAFFNAYDAMDGRATERTIHVGPNAWLGLAALQYEHRVKDGRFLPMARTIGDWLIRMQDAEGGLKGGPSVSWYSTEHNLDAYAFLSMLARETDDRRYEEAAGRELQWIKKYAYSNKDLMPNRGKGDSTIATDTFSWSIAALGPAKLKGLSFDPEAIMDFAEKQCRVETQYENPDGKISVVKGFDFAKARNLGRGGVISTEWTAQVIVTYRILSDYFNAVGEKEKALNYRQKADFYLNELQKLIITSPSRTGQGRGCLPYASMDNVDTGHGWRTPKGRRTGSVAGTAYGIFAWIGYNPFSFEGPQEVLMKTNTSE